PGHVDDPIELPEDLEVLSHREAHGDINVGAFEIQPVQSRMPVMNHVDPEHAHLSRRWGNKPYQHGDSRCLTGAIAAEKRRYRAGVKAEADAVDCNDVAVHLAQVADFHGRHLAGASDSGSSLQHDGISGADRTP